eukprot:4756267-Pleurochrysis_carterae.AAC.1
MSNRERMVRPKAGLAAASTAVRELSTVVMPAWHAQGSDGRSGYCGGCGVNWVNLTRAYLGTFACGWVGGWPKRADERDWGEGRGRSAVGEGGRRKGTR